MAKWWLLNVQFPEKSDRDVLQIYAADTKQAREVADTWLRQAGVVGPQERLVIEVRGAGSGDQFPNAPGISSAGIKNAPTGGGTPPPDGGGGAPPPDGVGGDTTPGGGTDPELENFEPRAAYLAGLAGRGANTGSIFGQYLSKFAEPYSRTFQLRQGLQGLLPQNAEALNAPFQEFARNNDLRGLRGEANTAIQALFAGGQTGVGGELRSKLDNPDETQANRLAQIAYQALQSRMSPLALELLRLPSGGDLRDRYLAQGGGGDEGGFLKYLQSQSLFSGL